MPPTHFLGHLPSFFIAGTQTTLCVIAQSDVHFGSFPVLLRHLSLLRFVPWNAAYLVTEISAGLLWTGPQQLSAGWLTELPLLQSELFLASIIHSLHQH